MLFFGGEALQDFSLALLIGIIFGTYSSVYIASPIMMLLQPKESTSN
jgi:preprotein translocase subunit SecF